MGLAASQSRFLAITARKANCEYRAMDIASKKLSITRDMQKATESYNRQLNSTKLIWNMDGSGSYAGIEVDLEYDTLMKASNLNDFMPYLLTDKAGRVVLDSKMTKAAIAAGLNQLGGTGRTVQGRNAFITALAGEGVVPDTTAQEIVDSGKNKTKTISPSVPVTYTGTGQYTKVSYGNETYYIDASGVFHEWDIENNRPKTATKTPIADSSKFTAAPTTYTEFEYTDPGNATLKTKYYQDMSGNYYKADYNTTTTPPTIRSLQQLQVVSEEGQRKLQDDANKISLSNLVKVLAPSNNPEDNLFNNVGVGMFPVGKTEAFTMNLEQLNRYIKNVLQDSKAKELTDADQQNAVDKLAQALTFTKLDGISTDNNQANSKAIIKNGENIKGTAFTLADLFSTDIVLNLSDSNNSDYNYTPERASTSEANEGFLETFITYLETAAKELLAPDQQADDSQALAYAREAIGMLLDKSINAGIAYRSDETWKSATSGANGANCWVYSLATGDNQHSNQAISLSNLAESFLTFYAQALYGFSAAPYTVANSSAESVMVTDDPSFMYGINNVYAREKYDQQILNYADFYNAMYNNICMNGWTTTTQDLNDKSYLQHALKNGQLFISSLHDDGFYYQDDYTRNGHVVEVTDENAIARAEVEYNILKSKLSYKEQVMDLDLKNIDMEISALTTEYDAVKGLISKNVEKVFQMFQ